ncbi:hypothetical protein HYW87_00405, partial [Candidatus Roizmanbacteria bacterium]|nr:hypothetical protein [Candidatus Roizmanbacteria bacterium]
MPREKEARFKGQEKFAHVRPVNSTEHTLPGGFPIWYEARQNNPIGWTGVNVFLGEAIEVPDMARQIDAGLSDNKTVQGFKRLWRFPYGTTYDQARLWSRQTVHFTMHYLLEVAGIRPDQIGLVALASGTPDGDLFLKE